MSTVLSNGVIVPDVGSTNWASDLETNWTLLNALIGAVGANVRLDRPNIWTAAQTFSDGIYGDLDGTAAMAVSDANGNEIATTYALKTEVTALATAVSGKAADNAVVHLAGAETITGDKTHDAKLAITGNNLFAWERPQVTRGTLPTSTVYYGTTRYRDANLSSFLLCRGSINTAGDMDYGMMMYPWLLDNSKGWSFYVSADGTNVWLRPIGDNVHLGMASHKWLSFNGVNPGALSFPANPGVSFSGDITNTTGTVTNPKTWTVNGWGYIRVPNRTTSDFVSVVTSGSYEAYLATGTGAGNTNIGVSFPIVAGRTYNIYVSTSGNVTAYFFPCLGNV